MRYELHPRNTAFEWRQPGSAVPTADARRRCAVPRQRIRCGARCVYGTQEIADSDCRDRSAGSADGSVSAHARQRHVRHRPRRRNHVPAAPGARSRRALRAFSRHPLLLGPVPRPDRPRRAALPRPGGLQAPRRPGGRFPWHQDNGYTFIYAAAVPDVLDRAHRRDASTTVVRGWCPACTGSARCNTAWTPLGFQCLEDVEGAVAVEARSGLDRGVLEPDAAPHRPQRDHVRCASLISCSTLPDGADCLSAGRRQPTPCDAPDQTISGPTQRESRHEADRDCVWVSHC